MKKKVYAARRVTALTAVLLAGAVILGGCAAPPDATVATGTPSAQAEATETTIPDPTATATMEESPLPTATMASPLATPTEAATQTPEAEAPDEGTWIADGVIDEDEYDQKADFGDIRLWWRHDGEFLYIAMEGDTTGWVAVGIDPEDGMAGANYLFGYVANGQPMLWDAFGTAPRGPNHPPDEELGGTNDIISSAGVEEDGVTRLEVQIPLDSGDEYDKALEPGQTYPMIVAIGGEDEFNAYHLRYDQGELVLK